MLDLDDLPRSALRQNNRSTAPIEIGRLRKTAQRGVDIVQEEDRDDDDADKDKRDAQEYARQRGMAVGMTVAEKMR